MINIYQMDDFRKHLNRKGKRSHVIDQLASHVIEFSQYLSEKQKDMLVIHVEDLVAYAEHREKEKKGTAKRIMRGISLYYAFIKQDNIAEEANKIRQNQINRNRTPFALKKFIGISKNTIEKLREIGIINTKQMLERGHTKRLRSELAYATEIAINEIDQLVAFSDLSRIKGIKAIRAKLYYEAGITSVRRFSEWNEESLYRMLRDFVEETLFSGIAPTPKEIRFTLKRAKEMPDVIDL